MERYCLVKTAQGVFGFVVRGGCLVASCLPDVRGRTLGRVTDRFPDAVKDNGLLPALQRDVAAYYRGERVSFSVKIDLEGFSPFHRLVLEACRKIPYGKTASYGDLARAAGREGAARAAGSAMARNVMPLIVPCHRVLRADGSIGGFSTVRGVAEKRTMLRLEGVSGDWAGGRDHRHRRRGVA